MLTNNILRNKRTFLAFFIAEILHAEGLTLKEACALL